jgi:hypothetical protein
MIGIEKRIDCGVEVSEDDCGVSNYWIFDETIIKCIYAVDGV